MTTNAKSEFDYRPSYLAASIAAGLVFLLYLLTLAPTTSMWDTSEYMAAAYTLGLPHPPGNPLFVLLGRVMSLLPIASSVAMRINIFAALCSAVAAAMWFLITERVLVGWFQERWRRIVGAGVATLIGATAFTVWNQSVVNEKVYTVSLAGIAIISWLMVRWCDNPDGTRADKTLMLVAYLLGLGYANHMAGMLAAPAVGLAVIVRRPRYLLRWKLILASLLALGFGLTPLATQPIRSAFNPPINEGQPTACTNGLHWSCTFSKGTYDAFMYNFNRGQYSKPALTNRQAPFVQGQVGMWWWYFKWQWMRDALDLHPGLQSVLAAAMLMLGLFGGWVHYKRDRPSWWYFASLLFTTTLCLIYYLNFRYGASQSPQLGSSVAREVRDRDYFFIWSFSPWGVWAALGLMYVWESVAALFGTQLERVARQTVQTPRRLGWLAGSPVLLVAMIPLMANWHWASRAGQTDTRDFAVDLLNSVEPYGVLVVAGDNDTFPLWYAQDVEGIRKDVVVANTSLLNTSWYVRQLIERPIYEYDAAKGPALYRGKVWPKPATSPLRLTTAEANAVPDFVPIAKRTTYTLGPINATIDPAHLPQDQAGTGYLGRADVFVLRMIADSFLTRPIYISRTAGTIADTLGLANNTLTQGLASKIFIPPATMGRDTVRVEGDGYFDVDTSRKLWNDVFLAPKSLAKRDGWVDRPSIGIPMLYVATAAELGQIEQSMGDPTGAARDVRDANGIIKALNLEGSFPALTLPPPPQPESLADSAVTWPASPAARRPQTPPNSHAPPPTGAGRRP
ncbi:MAG: glycosyltransferase family 117 protein [Gemmatimonadaceae bacterium]